MHSPGELEDYLRQAQSLPVYIKRSFGSYGRGNVFIQALDGDDLILGNGAREPIAKFCESLDDGKTLGWILQKPLTAHPDIQKLTKLTKISGVRVHTFLSPEKTVVTKAIFKINVGGRDSDNFEHGASGNMLAAVDIETGKIIRAISGVGLKQTWNPKNTISGMDIVGFQIPCWDEVLKLVKSAHPVFPGFLCGGWDIAICEDGPRILEINMIGDTDLSQHAYRVGFFDDHFLSLMNERGLQDLLHVRPRPHAKSPLNGRLGVRSHHWHW
jgi:hypothetical protein